MVNLLSQMLTLPPQQLGQIVEQMTNPQKHRPSPYANLPGGIKKRMGGTGANLRLPVSAMPQRGIRAFANGSR